MAKGRDWHKRKLWNGPCNRTKMQKVQNRVEDVQTESI